MSPSPFQSKSSRPHDTHVHLDVPHYQMMDIPGTSAPPLKKIPGYATSVANMSGIGVTETYIFFSFLLYR